MKIVVQAADLDQARIDGTRVYLSELLRRFGALAPEQTFLLAHRGHFNPALAPPDFPNYRNQPWPFPVAWMQTRFAFELWRETPERLFLPIQAAPFWLPSRLPVIATIHDLAFRRFPETFPYSHRLKLNLMLEAVLHRADQLIAVSQSTKRDLLEFFPHLPESKIRVIHHGFRADFFGERFAEATLTEKLKPFRLTKGGYALYVGALQPRKNLRRLIAAFEKTKTTHPDLRLVLAGEPAWLSRPILEACTQSQYRSDICLTGRIDFETLRALYQGARLLVFPSLYEGFGLPLLEAFASGVPVLTANNSSLTEVAGEAALFCEATSVEDMAQQLSRLWENEDLRHTLVLSGQEQLRQFSWERCARETLQVILGASRTNA